MSPYDIRKIILVLSKRANVGHIGSSLSVADIIAALYGGAMEISDPDDADRDRFILSKGHAALALYAALHLRGWIDENELNTFCQDNSALGVHPHHGVRGVDFGTGSLGHGLAMGAGAALAGRMSGSKRRVFALLSDAELNEGSVWEAAMFAAHHHLSNLTAIIDVNGQQAFGYTKEVLDLPNLVERWTVFGWDACEVDGHDIDAIKLAVAGDASPNARPRAIIARTIFGKGVPFMEGLLKWHYMPMNEDEFARAMDGLEEMK